MSPALRASVSDMVLEDPIQAQDQDAGQHQCAYADAVQRGGVEENHQRQQHGHAPRGTPQHAARGADGRRHTLLGLTRRALSHPVAAPERYPLLVHLMLVLSAYRLSTYC